MKTSGGKKRQKSRLREWTESIGVAVILVLVVRTFILEPYKIPTGSMEPTLLGVARVCPVCARTFGYDGRRCPYDDARLRVTRIGDRILVNKFLYGAKSPTKIPLTERLLPYFQLPALRRPRRWDVVVFHYPEDLRQNYVKRLAGLPGERIAIRGGELWIDGSPQPGPTHYYNQGNWGREGVEYQIPARGQALPLGPENFDLYAEVIRMDGHTPELMGTEIWIDGQPATEYRPRQDYYFLLGDNSANSKDSRYWGFVPDRYLLGKVFFVYWPLRRVGPVS